MRIYSFQKIGIDWPTNYTRNIRLWRNAKTKKIRYRGEFYVKKRNANSYTITTPFCAQKRMPHIAQFQWHKIYWRFLPRVPCSTLVEYPNKYSWTIDVTHFFSRFSKSASVKLISVLIGPKVTAQRSSIPLRSYAHSWKLLGFYWIGSMVQRRKPWFLEDFESYDFHFVITEPSRVDSQKNIATRLISHSALSILSNDLFRNVWWN